MVAAPWLTAGSPGSCGVKVALSQALKAKMKLGLASALSLDEAVANDSRLVQCG